MYGSCCSDVFIFSHLNSPGWWLWTELMCPDSEGTFQCLIFPGRSNSCLTSPLFCLLLWDSLQPFVLDQRLDHLLSYSLSTGPRTLRQYVNMWLVKVPNSPSLWTYFHTFWARNVSPLQGQMPKTQFPANLVNKHLLITYWVQNAK